MPAWLAWMLIGVGCLIAAVVIAAVAAVLLAVKAIVWLFRLFTARREERFAAHVDLALALHQAAPSAPRHRSEAEVLAAYESELSGLDEFYVSPEDFR